jgi:hypothetical protein
MEHINMFFFPNLKRLVFFTLIFITAISFQYCASMGSRDNFQALDGWNLSPEVLQKGNPDGVKCNCALTLEIEGGKESVLNLAKEIDNKPIGKK